MAQAAVEGAPTEDAPQWPDESAEAAFLSEQRSAGSGAPTELPKPPPRTEDEVDADKNAPLPPLQTLVDRIPAEARDVLEELFRAKFNVVRKVPKTALKA